MTNEKIPVPKDELNAKFLCCFPTRSWSGKRINGYQVSSWKVLWWNRNILKLKGQELLVKLTRDLIKSLHTKKDDNHGFMNLENELANGFEVVNKSYDENGCHDWTPSWIKVYQVYKVLPAKNLYTYQDEQIDRVLFTWPSLVVPPYLEAAKMQSDYLLTSVTDFSM